DQSDLPAPLPDLARRIRTLQQCSGEALLDAARWVTEARACVHHGAWYPLLETANISIPTAERLLQLHRQATTNPAFADAVRTNWLHPTVAMLLPRPSAPPEVIDAVLAAPDPPTAAILHHLRATHGDAQPLPP